MLAVQETGLPSRPPPSPPSSHTATRPTGAGIAQTPQAENLTVRWLRLFKHLKGQGRSTRHTHQLGRFHASFSKPAGFLISTDRAQKAALSPTMGSPAFREAEV